MCHRRNEISSGPWQLLHTLNHATTIMKPSEVTFCSGSHTVSTNQVNQRCQRKRTSPTNFSEGLSHCTAGTTREQPERADRAVCQGEASRSSASTWLKTLVLFEKIPRGTSLAVPFFLWRRVFPSFREPWLQLCRGNNASVSVILNQLHGFFPVPKEELMFSRSLQGQSRNRHHMRT